MSALLNKFICTCGRTDQERNECAFFFFIAFLTIMWCILIGIEAFQINVPGHVLNFEVTIVWMSALSAYTSHKGFARWNNETLDGPHYGKAIGFATIIYGFLLYGLYMLVARVVIPQQLNIGLEGILTNVFGWEVIKVFHARKKNHNGNGSAESL